MLPLFGEKARRCPRVNPSLPACQDCDENITARLIVRRDEQEKEEEIMAGRAPVRVGVFSFLVFVAGFVSPAVEALNEEDGIQKNNRFVGTSEEAAFVSFARKYGKEYNSREEYLHRLGVFVKNLAKAAEHQALDPSAVHGITPFSDLNEEEFERCFTGLATAGGGDRRRRGGAAGRRSNWVGPRLNVKGLPSNFDWRERGAVTKVKMQV